MTYSILSHLRTGSTVSGQTVALYLHNKFQNYNKEYQGEITNIYENLMYFDEKGKDCIVPHNTIPKNSYTKTYGIVNEQIQRIKDFDNLNILKKGTEEYINEIKQRIACLDFNQKAPKKSIFKLQTNTFCLTYKQYVQKELDTYKFIFCIRNLSDQFISWITTKHTRTYHNLTNEVVQVPRIHITRTDLDNFIAQSERTIDIFKYYRKQIICILEYEKWYDNPMQIYKILKWDDYKDYVNEKDLNQELFNKLRYSHKPKDYIINYNEVLKWLSNEPIFKYKFQ